MRLKIVNTSENKIPDYSTIWSAGMDLRANLSDSLIIQPMERVLVPTGLFMAIPEGMEGQIRPRSGLAYKHGITVLNTPGTIDADYRGEIKVLLVNLSNEVFGVKNGDRIAQIVFSKYEKLEPTLVFGLSETVRGNGGFGHTGKK